MIGLLGSFINALANLGSTAITNTANSRLNAENVALQRETNAQQMEMQNRVNQMNQNAPTTQFSQIVGLGASRGAALGALGAPQSAGAPTLTAPRNDHAMQAANIDIKDMFDEFTEKTRAEIDNLRADSEQKRQDVSSSKTDELREKMSQSAIKAADELYNWYIEYLGDSKDKPDYSHFLQSLDEEQRKKVDEPFVAEYLQERIKQYADTRNVESSTSLNSSVERLNDVKKRIANIDLKYHDKHISETLRALKAEIDNLEQEHQINAYDELMSKLKTQWLELKARKHGRNRAEIMEYFDNLYDISRTDSHIQQDKWIRWLSNLFGDSFAKEFLNAGTRIVARGVTQKYLFAHNWQQ